MASTKKILTSLHGKLVGVSADGKLTVKGRTIRAMDDTGCEILLQPTPATQNATGTLTAAQLKTGIITSTTAAAVAATVPTGTLLDASFSGDDALLVGEGFDWAVIVTGANALTVTAGTGHTLVGNAVVPTATSGRFRSVKTAANTFVTYRL